MRAIEVSEHGIVAVSEIAAMAGIGAHVAARGLGEHVALGGPEVADEVTERVRAVAMRPLDSVGRNGLRDAAGMRSR